MRLTMVVPDLPIALNAALEGLVRLNTALLLAGLRVGRPVPPLYSLGIRYGRERHGREWWQTVADNLAERGRKDAQIDCEDLAGHRAAEARVGGLLAALRASPRLLTSMPLERLFRLTLDGWFYPARAICVRTGRKTYHAVVEHPDGRIEDPSRALGMKVPHRRTHRSDRP